MGNTCCNKQDGAENCNGKENEANEQEFAELYKIMTNKTYEVKDQEDFDTTIATDKTPEALEHLFHDDALTEERALVAASKMSEQEINDYLDKNEDAYFAYLEANEECFAADEEKDEENDDEKDEYNNNKIESNFDKETLEKTYILVHDQGHGKETLRANLIKYITKTNPQLFEDADKLQEADEEDEEERKASEKLVEDNANSESRDTEYEKPKRKFHNSTLKKRMKKAGNKPKFYSPKNYDELCQIISYAGAEKKPIRAVGTKYGYNDITFTDGVFIKIYKHLWHPVVKIKQKVLNKTVFEMKNLLDIEIEQKLLNKNGLKIFNDNLLTIVEAGTTVQIVHNVTWPLQDRMHTCDPSTGKPYRVLKYWGGTDQLSLGGLINVGAQGYGGISPAIANQVLSFRFLTLTKDGKLRELQIEPTDGIHDKDAFDKYHKSINSNVELIQDDEYFNATLVSVGSMGVIYSFHIQLQYAFNVKSFSFVTSLKLYKQCFTRLQKLSKSGFLSNHKVFFQPYRPGYFGGGQQKVWVRLDYNTTQPRTITNEEISKVCGALHGSQRASIAGAAAIVWVSHAMPWRLGFFLNAAFKAACYKRPVVLDAPTAFSSGVSVAVPVQLTGNAVREDTFLDAIDVYSKKFREKKLGFLKYRQTSPCAVCFVDKAVGYIGMSSGNEPTAWLETPFPDFRACRWFDTYKWKRSMKVLHQTLSEKPYYSKQHLACYPVFFNEKVWKTTEKYPDIDIFVKIYKEMNASRLFCNSWTKNYGIDKLAFGDN